MLVSSAAAALVLLALRYGSLTFAAASIGSLPADVAPTPALVTSIGGIQSFASNLAGVGLASFVGYMLARSGGFMPALITASAFALVGACSYLFIVGKIEPIQMNKSARSMKA